MFGKVKNNLGKYTFVTSLAFSALSCTPAFQGEYSDPNAVEVVDDRWNETDARKSSEILISSMLKKAWLSNHKKEHNGQKPVVVVGDLQNRTDEHIDMQTLIEAVRNELINSGEVRFVNAEQRKKILEEVAYQNDSGNVSNSTKTKKGNQTGADFLLNGAISSTVHTQDGLKTVTYQVNLILTSLETTEINWSEKYNIKKRFQRSGSKW